MTEALRAVLRELRQRPEPPPEDAGPGEHWHFLWRSLAAAMLTWQFLAIYIAVAAAAGVWEAMT